MEDKTVMEFEKASRLIVGLNDSTNTGRPFPNPIFNYYRKLQSNGSFLLGMPITNYNYFLGIKHIIQAFTALDGFFSNIQKDRVVTYSSSTVAIADYISMKMVLGGLR